jgi:hypothetical protein
MSRKRMAKVKPQVARPRTQYLKREGPDDGWMSTISAAEMAAKMDCLVIEAAMTDRKSVV